MREERFLSCTNKIAGRIVVQISFKSLPIMTTQTMDATLIATSHPDVTKRTNVAGLIFSAVMLAAGILLFVSIFGMTDKSSTLSMAMMVLGTAFILTGVFRLFWKSTEMIYLPTKSVTRERSIFFDMTCLNRLEEMLAHDRLNGDSDVRSSGSGNVRMDVMLSRDSQFAAVQLYQFVPYTYTPVTEVHYFTGADAVAVSIFLEKCKSA